MGQVTGGLIEKTAQAGQNRSSSRVRWHWVENVKNQKKKSVGFKFDKKKVVKLNWLIQYINQVLECVSKDFLGQIGTEPKVVKIERFTLCIY